MLKYNVFKAVFWLGIFSLFFVGSCFVRANSKDVIYLIPEKFEGAIVVVYDQKDGVAPSFDGTEYVFNIPDSGVLKTNVEAKEINGQPSFFLVDGSGSRTKLEYLYFGGPKFSKEQRTEADLSDEERNNKVFAMNYVQGNFNTSNGNVKYKSFLVCKPKDGNLFASRDLNRKITDLYKTTSRQ